MQSSAFKFGLLNTRNWRFSYLHSWHCGRYSNDNFDKSRFGWSNRKFISSMSISLTEKEEHVCSVLSQTCEYLRKTKPNHPPVVLRINGGWVRDKLLGLDGHDIDIAIDTMMGFDFAQIVNEYLTSHHYKTVSVAKIEKNPDQSKHLETAHMKILDYEVDLVNLRSESYSEDSRIPTLTTFGTPFEDASRRDITINSLFYNIQTREVEDFTGKGLDDLKNGIIRTPLRAYETFRDDPLRILRCIRFASRFGFKLADDIPDAIKDKRILDAFSNKVSRERIGIEVEKMLIDPSASRAVEYFFTLCLYDYMFPLPPKETIESITNNMNHGEENDYIWERKRLHGLVETLSKQLNKANTSESTLPKHLAIPLIEHRYFWLALCALPFSHVNYRPLPKKKGGSSKSMNGVQYAVLDALKLSKVYANIASMFTQTNSFIEQIEHDKVKGKSEKVALGNFVRKLSTKFGQENGRRWPLALVFAAFTAANEADSQYRIEIGERIKVYDLEEIYAAKPILNGDEIKRILNIKPGKQMSVIVDDLAEWQIEQHPRRDPEACASFLKERYGHVS